MASMASTMFATETSSAFLGTALPTSQAVSGKARVSMGYIREDLERKPLALLRVLARQQGIPIVSKQVIIDTLMKKGSYSYSPSYTSSTPTSYYSSSSSSFSSAPASGDAATYNSMSLGELRALAKSRGLRGDTKAELIKLLISTPASSPAATSYGNSYSSPSGSSVPAQAATGGLPKAVLERKSLSELRAMARVRGLRGDTKAELVKLLSSDSAGPVHTPYVDATPAYSYSNGAASNGSSNGAGASLAARQLATKSLSQLRAMAAIKGIRGTTKHELVKQLAMYA